MGTHFYIFSPADNIPTLGELLDWMSTNAQPLKLNPEMFDDDDEEQEFLAAHLDSRDWRSISFANLQDLWALNISYRPANGSYFPEDMQFFWDCLNKAPQSTAKQTVTNHLNATKALFDIQISYNRETWDTQGIFMNYFYERYQAIAFLEGYGDFVQGKKHLLRSSSE